MTEFSRTEQPCFAALFENTDNPALIQENGNILAINKAMIKVFGYPEEMLIGEDIQTLIDTFTPPGERGKILRRIQAGEEQPYRTQCFAQNGTIMTVEIVPKHVSDEEGRVYIVVLRSIDESFNPLFTPNEINLSSQQEAVLSYISTALTYKEIANKLQISSSTVHYHKRALFQKLQVCSRVEAATWFLKMERKDAENATVISQSEQG